MSPEDIDRMAKMSAAAGAGFAFEVDQMQPTFDRLHELLGLEFGRGVPARVGKVRAPPGGDKFE